ncbi:hypothetical protein M8J75_009315 [Diaphorina citri]|nr:hypothetical protein M8J75_009315 [Diaphorina citri]
MYNTRICFHYEHLTRILTTRSVFVAALCLLMVCGGFCEAAQRTQPIFMNEFAVRLSSGDAADADRIAAKHGFVNVGQRQSVGLEISTLSNNNTEAGGVVVKTTRLMVNGTMRRVQFTPNTLKFKAPMRRFNPR